MNIINHLINQLPYIIAARDNKIDYKSIKESLLDAFNITTTESDLRQLLYSYKKNVLKSKFKHFNLAIMTPADILLNSDVMKYLIRFNDSSELVFLLNSNVEIKDKYKVTVERIKLMENPVDRIYAKWFARMFNIYDSELVNFDKISQNQLDEINIIPTIIDDISQDINKKILNRIMKR